MQAVGKLASSAVVVSAGYIVATSTEVGKVISHALAQHWQAGGSSFDPRVDQLSADMRALLMSQGGRNTVVLSQGGSSSGKVMSRAIIFNARMPTGLLLAYRYLFLFWRKEIFACFVLQHSMIAGLAFPHSNTQKISLCVSFMRGTLFDVSAPLLFPWFHKGLATA
jgi:hypothetical protein